jgi:hypothetical protein
MGCVVREMAPHFQCEKWKYGRENGQSRYTYNISLRHARARHITRAKTDMAHFVAGRTDPGGSSEGRA